MEILVRYRQQQVIVGSGRIVCKIACIYVHISLLEDTCNGNALCILCNIGRKLNIHNILRKLNFNFILHIIMCDKEKACYLLDHLNRCVRVVIGLLYLFAKLHIIGICFQLLIDQIFPLRHNFRTGDLLDLFRIRYALISRHSLLGMVRLYTVTGICLYKFLSCDHLANSCRICIFDAEKLLCITFSALTDIDIILYSEESLPSCRRDSRNDLINYHIAHIS